MDRRHRYVKDTLQEVTMIATATAPVKYAGRNYIIECAVVMGAYVGAVWARPWLVAMPPIIHLRLWRQCFPPLPSG
jgi:hypothetical protein